jgi:hypothetical protein
MAIIPRLVIFQGDPIRSVCPFCVGTLWQAKTPESGVRKWFKLLLSGVALLMAFILFVAFRGV